MTGIILKLLILRTSTYQQLTLTTILHVLLANTIELLTFFGMIACLLTCIPYIRRQLDTITTKLWIKIYFGVLFPEVFRVLAIMLYIFEVESELLLLLGLVILSIQYQALQSITSLHISPTLLGLIFIMAILSRLLIKMMIYPTHALILLGGLT